MRVYWSSIEYRYLEGNVNYNKYEGGVVYSFAWAKDVLDAINKFRNEFAQLNICIYEVEFVSPYDDIPWDTEDEKKKFDGIAMECERTEEVICDDFYAFEKEE